MTASVCVHNACCLYYSVNYREFLGVLHIVYPTMNNTHYTAYVQSLPKLTCPPIVCIRGIHVCGQLVVQGVCLLTGMCSPSPKWSTSSNSVQICTCIVVHVCGQLVVWGGHEQWVCAYELWRWRWEVVCSGRTFLNLWFMYMCTCMCVVVWCTWHLYSVFYSLNQFLINATPINSQYPASLLLTPCRPTEISILEVRIPPTVVVINTPHSEYHHNFPKEIRHIEHM